MEDCVYRLCKKCGAENYDNCDQEHFEHTEDGKVIVEPASCDKCNFELVLSESNLLH